VQASLAPGNNRFGLGRWDWCQWQWQSLHRVFDETSTGPNLTLEIGLSGDLSYENNLFPPGFPQKRCRHEFFSVAASQSETHDPFMASEIRKNLALTR